MPNNLMTLYILEAINFKQSNITLKDAMNITYQFMESKTHNEILKLENDLSSEKIALSFHHNNIHVVDNTSLV